MGLFYFLRCFKLLSNHYLTIWLSNRHTEKYTHNRGWTNDRLKRSGITLTIIGDLVVSVLNRNSFTLSCKKEVIRRYNQLFQRNWNTAKYPKRFYWALSLDVKYSKTGDFSNEIYDFELEKCSIKFNFLFIW